MQSNIDLYMYVLIGLKSEYEETSQRREGTRNTSDCGWSYVMTLVTGPTTGLPWSQHDQPAAADATDPQQDSIKGALMIAAGCPCWACFVIF